MCVFGHLPTVVVHCRCAMIILSYLRVFQVLCIIADGEHQLVGHHFSCHEFQGHLFCHFHGHHPCFVKIIAALQHLSAAERVGFRTVCLYHIHCARLPSPRMVNQQFCIHAKHFVDQFIVLFRESCQFAHGINAINSQFLCDTTSDAPEIGQRAVVPELFSVIHFVQFGNAHPVLVCRCFLCHYIHGHLAKIEVRPDTRRSRDACLLQHVAYHRHSHFVGCQFHHIQIIRDVHQHFVNGVDVYVLRRHILQIDAIDLGAHLNVTCHARHGHDVVHRPVRVCFQLIVGY